MKEMSEAGTEYLDYGDTPATKGIYEASCSVVGGSITGADLIMKEEISHAFNPGGSPSCEERFCGGIFDFLHHLKNLDLVAHFRYPAEL